MAKEHIISVVRKDSIAEEMGLEPGDAVISINDVEIEDVFDYRFLINDEYLEVLIKTKQGEECILEIEKEFDEELGIEFETGLMDNCRRCQNNCIFCFIDQNPKGMREAMYFKDDDTRLSFLQGNYITLTNISDHDLNRIIRYRLEPVNISFQTMNPELRCKMLNNRFAGEALKKVDRLFEAGIKMNGQIVLCKGINDKEELRFSLDKLLEYYPLLESVSVVPVGITKFRDGLHPLEPFTKEDACEIIDIVNEYQKKALKMGELHFVHASDEWYLLAERELPKEEEYDGYLQYENGVGMLTSLIDETREALKEIGDNRKAYKINDSREVSLAVGTAAYEIIHQLCLETEKVFPGLKTNVYPVQNKFYGERITVSGLLTAGDIISQIKGKNLGDELLLTENMVRIDEEIFLDDMSVSDVQNALQVHIRIVKSNGMDFVKSLLGI